MLKKYVDVTDGRYRWTNQDILFSLQLSNLSTQQVH